MSVPLCDGQPAAGVGVCGPIGRVVPRPPAYVLGVHGAALNLTPSRSLGQTLTGPKHGVARSQSERSEQLPRADVILLHGAARRSAHSCTVRCDVYVAYTWDGGHGTERIMRIQRGRRTHRSPGLSRPETGGGDLRPMARTRRPKPPRTRIEDRALTDDQAARPARSGPRRMAPRIGTTSRQRPDLPNARRRRVEAPRLAELAPARLPARGEGGRGDG